MNLTCGCCGLGVESWGCECRGTRCEWCLCCSLHCGCEEEDFRGTYDDGFDPTPL